MYRTILSQTTSNSLEHHEIVDLYSNFDNAVSEAKRMMQSLRETRLYVNNEAISVVVFDRKTKGDTTTVCLINIHTDYVYEAYSVEERIVR